MVGTCDTLATGVWQKWETGECDVEGINEVHDIFFVFIDAQAIFLILSGGNSNNLYKIKENFNFLIFFIFFDDEGKDINNF